MQFRHTDNVWPIIEKWARENSYLQKFTAGTERMYQKGTGFLVAPMMLKIRSEKEVTTLEAWIRINLFTRIMSLFFLPSELGIESGGFKAVIPRDIARGAVNKLLAQLGQPLIR